MNKIVKRRLIGSLMCFMIGIGIWVYESLNAAQIGEELQSYLSGFSSGVLGVRILLFNLYLACNPKSENCAKFRKRKSRREIAQH